MIDIYAPQIVTYDRRKFLGHLGIGIVGTTILTSLPGCHTIQSIPSSSSAAAGKGSYDASTRVMVPLPQKKLDHKSEPDEEKFPEPQAPSKRTGFAIVGLGNLVLGQVLPAFGKSQYARPVALVSGDAEKARKVAEQYAIDPKNIYNYDNYDEMRNNPDIDAVYIALPNSMHHEFTIRAAQAGKHVLCEKPMANSVRECEEMIKACKDAGRKLMIAYRIQYEPNNRLAMKWTREKKYGRARVIEMYNGQNIGDPRQWRLKKSMSGGGAMPDVGIYCLNTCRFLLGEEPQTVFASTYSTPGDERFTEVEESMMFQLQFPGGTIASCATSYGVHASRNYRVLADNGGYYGLDPAFSYEGLKMNVNYSEGKEHWDAHPSVGAHDQFTLELDHMAQCIQQDKAPYTTGEEGMQDMRIIEALYLSAAERRPVELAKISGSDVFRGTEPKEDNKI